MNKKVNISKAAVCPLASCSRSNTCARYARYQQALAEEDTFMMMNLGRLGVDGEACPYHLTAQKQRWAKGFVRLYASIPHGSVHCFFACTPFAKRRFYKARKGEVLISPHQQQQLLAAFQKYGGDITLGFDGYVDQEVLLEE